MNQLCKVCGEPAAGFHFGAFTCEGCKSFFGRTYNNISAIAGCKNSGECVINKKNRTACKACRLRKCLVVGMSKSGSRYGRRSNWFKIHCLLQDAHQATQPITGTSGAGGEGAAINNIEQITRLHQMQARQTYQDKTNPCIKTSSMSPILGADLPPVAINNIEQIQRLNQMQARHNYLEKTASMSPIAGAGAELPTAINDVIPNDTDTNTNSNSNNHHHNNNNNNNNVLPISTQLQLQKQHLQHMQYFEDARAASRLSDETPSDSGASSAYGDADAGGCIRNGRNKHTSSQFGVSSQAESGSDATLIDDTEDTKQLQREFLEVFCSKSGLVHNPFIALTNLYPPSVPTHPSHIQPAQKRKLTQSTSTSATTATTTSATTTTPTPTLEAAVTQDEPLDLSLRSICHTAKNSQQPPTATAKSSERQLQYAAAYSSANLQFLGNVIQRPAPLNLTLSGSK